MARVVCNNCGKKVPEGRFCIKCQEPLVAAENNVSAPAEEEQADVESLSGMDTIPVPETQQVEAEPEISSYITEKKSDSSLTTEEQAPVQEKKGFLSSIKEYVMPPESLGDREPEDLLSLEFDKSLIFVEGMNIPLKFRVTLKASYVKKIKLICDVNGTMVKTDFAGLKRKGQSRIKNIDYFADMVGGNTINIQLSFEYAKEEYVLEAQTEILVNRKEAVLKDLTLNINNEIQAGHAADISVNPKFAELDELRKNSDKVESLINNMHKGESDFIPLDLYDVTGEKTKISFGKPPVRTAPARTSFNFNMTKIIPPRSVQTEISISRGNKLVHLYSGNPVTVGRHKQNDIVTRCFNEQHVATKENNLMISSFHCMFGYDNVGFYLHDASNVSGVLKASTNGSYVDGIQLGGNKSYFQDNIPKTVTLGGVISKPGVIGLMVRVLNIDENDKAALLIERTDNVDECFIIVKKGFLLKDIFTDLKDMVIFYNKEQGGFGWADPTGKNDWLTPGYRLSLAQDILGVEEKKQYWL